MRTSSGTVKGRALDGLFLQTLGRAIPRLIFSIYIREGTVGREQQARQLIEKLRIVQARAHLTNVHSTFE